MSENNFSLPALLHRLEQSFSRGFTTGWLEGNQPHRLVSEKMPSHRGTPQGTILEVRRDAVVVKLLAPIRRGDGVVFENMTSPENSQGGRVYEIIRRKESVKEAEAGAKVLLTFANNSIDASYVAENQTVWKTDDPHREREIQKSWKTAQPQRRISLNINVSAKAGAPIEIFVTIPKRGTTTEAYISIAGDAPLEPARKHPLTVETLREQLGRLGGTLYELGHLEADIVGNPMVPLSVLGTLRRKMVSQLDALPLERKNYSLTANALESLRNERKTP